MNELVERNAHCGLFMHEANCVIIRADGSEEGGLKLGHHDFHYEDIKKADEEGFVREGKIWPELYRIKDLIYRRYDDWTSPSHLLTYPEFFRLGKPRRLNLEVKVSYLLSPPQNTSNVDYICLQSVKPEGDRSKTLWFAAETL